MRKQRVYLAGRFEDRKVLCEWVKELQDWVTVTADWITIHEQRLDDPEYRKFWAFHDEEQVLDADLLIMKHDSSGGTSRWVEMGMAIGKGIPVWIVGTKPTSIFSEVLAVTIFPTFEDMLKYLKIRVRR